LNCRASGCSHANITAQVLEAQLPLAVATSSFARSDRVSRRWRRSPSSVVDVGFASVAAIAPFVRAKAGQAHADRAARISPRG
jgi:hypothetical protein